jgi:diguanylate cyclase (GGDEF)-like protein/PAS domain S-box-containing protein
MEISSSGPDHQTAVCVRSVIDDALGDVRRLKVRILLSVYLLIAVMVPFHVLLGLSPAQIAFTSLIGVAFATIIIQAAFREILRLRKRSALPTAFTLRLGECKTTDEAAAAVLDLTHDIFGAENGRLALDGDDGYRIVTRGESAAAATGATEGFDSCLSTGEVSILREGGVTTAYVPLLAPTRRVGVLFMSATRPGADLRDRQLLGAVGSAVVVSLEGLRQKETAISGEARLRSVLMNAPVVVFAIDNSGVVSFMQGKGLLALGVAPEVVVGRQISEAFQNYPEILQGFRRAFAGDQVTSSAVIEIDEVQTVFEYHLAPERDELGRVVGIIGVATDVTQRTQAEEAFRESKRALESLVCNVPGFLYRCLNDRDWTIEYVSDGVAEITGHTPEEFTSHAVAYNDLVHPDDRQLVWDCVQEACQSGERYQLEYRVLHRNGETMWVWEQGQAVWDEFGDLVALEGFVSDVTQRKAAETALAESEERYRDLFENAREMILAHDMQGRIITVNRAAEKITGYSEFELLSMTAGDLIPAELQSFARDVFKRLCETKDPVSYEIEILAKDGRRVPLEVSQRLMLDENGQPLLTQGISRDISERKLAERALEESEARYRDLFENANDIIFTHDLEGRFHSVNRKAENAGVLRDELLTGTVWNVIAPEYREAAQEHLKRVLNGEDPGPFEVELVGSTGKRVPLEVSERVLLDDEGKPYLIQGIARDISERRQAEETIRRLAYHDALTGLPNRALFEDRLGIALAQSRRQGEMLAVMFLDIDGFKVVNDSLGHGAGDRLLQDVARDLSLLVRDGDTVARVGGDEFTLLLPGIEKPEDAIDVAQRILERLRQTRTIDGQEFRATGSVGITTYPADGIDGETLLRNADTAMYRAKERGRDNYQLYTPAMNERMMERLAFENDLRHALAREEFTLHYQPVVTSPDGRIVGAEALLRWRHSERGLVLPDEFIPFAEESGLIVEIGEYVIRRAARQLQEWIGAGLHPGWMAVNLSARQLQQEDLVSRIARVLRETGVSPALLQLEITEGAVLENVDYITSMLVQLRAMGIGISLDDFGTGYSSLTYLKRFPIDSVKIDRSFVSGLNTDPSDAAIVSAVISMAASLNLRVIAEGVETIEQFEFLRGRGCSEFQGYLFSRPIPAEAFRAILESGGVLTGVENGHRAAKLH